MADTKIKIMLTLEGEAAKEFQASIKSMNEFEKAATKAANESSRAFDVLKGVLGAEAIKQGLKTLINLAGELFQTFVVDGVRAAGEQQDALNALAQSMRLTGEFSQQALDGMDAFASEMQRTTGQGDELTLQMLALAKSFGISNEESQKLVQAATQLSAATGQSLETAVENLGRAYSGTAGRLATTIPIIKGLTEEQLKAGAATDLVLSRFSGSAEARLKTFSGAVTASKNSFEDLQKAIGSVIIQNPAVIAAINGASQIFERLTNHIKENESEYKKLIQELLIFGIAMGQGVVDSIAQAEIAFKTLQLRAVEANGVLSSALSWLPDWFEEWAAGDKSPTKNMERAAEKAIELGAELQALKTKGNPTLQSLQAEFDKLRKSIQEADATAKSAAGSRDTQGVSGFSVPVNIEETQKTIDEEAEIYMQRMDMLNGMDDERSQFQMDLNRALLESIANDEQTSVDTKLKIQKKFLEQEKQINQERLAVTRNVLGTVSSLQNSKVKELAVLGKAAAIAQATINTYQGATLALATIPPPWGFIAAAATVTAGIANVAKIAGVPGLQEGISTVPGSGYSDNYPAMLAPGERVVDRGTNEDLKGFLQSSRGQIELLRSINNRLGNLQSNVVVNVGGKQIADIVRDQFQSGRAVA